MALYTSSDLNNQHQDQFSREVRLGLVLYGGISLALYINGVAQEFYRSVRGSGIYRLVKVLTDSDIVVDVVSGASAGGINGILLAYALSNNKNFKHTTRLWREHAAVQRMFCEPGHNNSIPQSLFDGEGYYQSHLERAFTSMDTYVPEDAYEQDTYDSKIDELDLFITGTHVAGNKSTIFDDTGHPISLKDHRTIFWLKHRNGRKLDLSPKSADGSLQTTCADLAKLARITSCFPVAFAPIPISVSGKDPVDVALCRWGQIKADAYFIDGGVLDNKPFTSTIQAIYSRTANRNVDRKLFYVEPSPEQIPQQDGVEAPTMLETIQAALIGIPRYESISGDLQQITDRNTRLDQYWRLVNALQPADASGRDDTAINRVAEELDSDRRAAEVRHLHTRFIFLSERVLDCLKQQPSSLSPTRREQLSKLIQAFDKWLKNSPKDTHRQLLDRFDVYYQQRRVFRIVYLIFDLLYNPTQSINRKAEQKPAYATPDEYHKLWSALNRQIEAYEIIAAAMQRLVEESDRCGGLAVATSAERLWQIVQGALDRLIGPGSKAARLFETTGSVQLSSSPGEELSKDTLRSLHSIVNDQISTIVSSLNPVLKIDSEKGILEQLACHEQHLIAALDKNDPVRCAYEQFAELDARMLPIEMAGGLFEKDRIETVRISALDARRGFCNRDGAKLMGTSLNAFGGFFKRSWRSNDILWGRLDGLCELIETLLDHERLRQIIENDKSRDTLRRRLFGEHSQGSDADPIIPALDPANLFPASSADTHNEIRQWLRKLVSENGSLQEALGDDFDHALTLLIEAAQLEILHTELPNVLYDAAIEQAEWGQMHFTLPMRAQRRSGEPLARQPNGTEAQETTISTSEQPMGNCRDAVIRSANAAAWVQSMMQSLNTPGIRPTETGLGQYFRTQYRARSAEITDDIPVSVWLDILRRALKMLHACAPGLVGARSNEIQRNKLFSLGMSFPLQIGSSIVWLLSRLPRTAQALLVPALRRGFPENRSQE